MTFKGAHMKTMFITLMLAISAQHMAFAEESPAANQIPTDEKEFVKVIKSFDKAKIVEQLGDPAEKDDLRNGKTGEVIASIWQYHFLNTNEEGAYYETTELDFIGDKVNVVVFMNNDGADQFGDARGSLPPLEEPAQQKLQ